MRGAVSTICHKRPHQGIGDLVPADRYHPSSRTMPPSPPEIVYDDSCLVRKVTRDGRITFINRQLFVSNAFAGKPIGRSRRIATASSR